MERTSESGLPVDPVYDESKLTDFRPDEKLGRPGEYPFTRGVHPRDALRADSTLGEVCDALRDVWGTCRPERI